MTTAANPWNAVYNLAAGKRNTSTQITLRKPDGSLTIDTEEPLRLMLDNVTPEDNKRDDNDYHKQVRAQAQQPANTAENEFTIEEIRNAAESMNKKAPAEDGITGDIYNHIFKS
jgi:hypothetical protein